MIHDGETGFLVEPGDTEAIAWHLRRLADNPDELEQLRKTARAFAERNLDITAIPRDMTDIASTPSPAAEGFWSGRRVLVTGGCGFIGSHLVDVLIDVGAVVVVLDAYNSTSIEVSSRARELRA